MEERLNKWDFHEPPEEYFSCVECGVETTSIIRDREKRKYVAEFFCNTEGCSAKPWHKCRVCCEQNQCLHRRITQHIGYKCHLKRVAQFEAKQSQAYIIRENWLVGGEYCFQSPPVENEMRILEEDQAEMGAEFEVEFEVEEEDDNDDNDAEMIEEQPPQTIEEWKQKLVSQSGEPSKNNFSGYFPEEVETRLANSSMLRKPLNRQYFRYNLHCGQGPRVLYAHAIIQCSGPDIVRSASPNTTLWCMLLAILSHHLTRSDQRILLALITHLNTVRDEILPVPLDPSMLRRMYVDGVRSIPNILPRPIIHSLPSGFVYVSIRSILQFHLANGQSIDPLVSLPHWDKHGIPALHGSSARGTVLLQFTIMDENDFPVEVVIWSDGFDANNTKNNRGSVHVIFVSIGTPEDNYHSGCNTYPVSIGPADGDLSEVAKLVAEELKRMSCKIPNPNIFFDGQSKKEISFVLLVYCFLQDRPERCHWLSLAYGNGKYAGRFGWAGDLSQDGTFEILPSCPVCNEMRMKNTAPRSCDTPCRDWCMDELFYEAPENYPTIFEDTNPAAPTDQRRSIAGSWYLPFFKISFDQLKKAIRSTYNLVCLNIWTKKEGVAFLETFALSPDLIDQICKAADNLDPLPTLPASWSIPGVDVKHHIDVPMHLLFLGVTKANSKDLIGGWLKSKRKSTSFIEKSHAVLKEVKKLSLAWCKAETKFGGYVSENWIAYCRLFKYVNRLIAHKPATADQVYQDPEGVEMSQYTLTQKRDWMRARKIEGVNKRTRKKEVEEKFDKFLMLPRELLPDIVEEIASSATIEQVEHMVACWQACVSRIMAVEKNPSEETIEDVGRHIKLFLTAVEVFDSSRRGKVQASKKKNKKKELPVWRVKPNYLGLLNLPDTLKEMGPIRMLTELDFKGEASIKLIKKWIKKGLTGHWAYTAMLGFYREKSFKFVLKDCVRDIAESCSVSEEAAKSFMLQVASEYANEPIEQDEDEEEVTVTTRYKSYRTFATRESALESLQANKVVSGAVLDDRLYLMIESGAQVEIKPSHFQSQACGADYFLYGPVPPSASEEVVQELSEFFLLLPRLRDDGTCESGSFHMITSKWREVVASSAPNDYALSMPRVPGASY